MSLESRVSLRFYFETVQLFSQQPAFYTATFTFITLLKGLSLTEI